MADDDRPLRIAPLRALLATLAGDNSTDDEHHNSDRSNRRETSGAKDLIAGLASWAGKGKDEIIQMICREIGQAVAAVIREPMDQALEGRKLKITLELVPKHKEEPLSKSSSGSRKKTTTKSKTTSRKKTSSRS